MRGWLTHWAPGLVAVVAVCVAFVANGWSAEPPVPTGGTTASGTRAYEGRGTILEIKPDGVTAVIRHAAVTNYMPAMTMPFQVKADGGLSQFKVGDEVTFRLVVTGEQSWIDRLTRTGHLELQPDVARPPVAAGQGKPPPDPRALLDYKFTNELGAPVCFNDYRGQVIVYTFLFTRCPAPNFCPRLSRNFEEASQKLAAMPNAPANWHLISVSFDPDFDTPSVLREYARHYHYDPKRWTFLTGPKEMIGELARLSGVEYRPEEGLFNHNFRTLIVDAAGRLQAEYPIGGDLSDAIVTDIIKAAAAGRETPKN